MDAPKPTVPVIVGPTAVGKTAVVLALARLFPVTAISADSRQIYRGLDIGTAKPTTDELRIVPHLGLDVVSPGERYSAGKFAEDAATWIRSIGDSRQAVVVGGTGFYVRALAEGLFREPPMDGARRESFGRWAQDSEVLDRWASRLDNGYCGGGRQRASRAVEVALLTGRSLSWWQRKSKLENAIVPWYIRLAMPRPALHARIEMRIRLMLEAGFVDEVRDALDNGVSPDAPGLDGVGYREVVAYLIGDLSEDELPARIATSTRRYAKRQETWFRHQLPANGVLVLDATEPADVMAQRIGEFWLRRGNE